MTKLRSSNIPYAALLAGVAMAAATPRAEIVDRVAAIVGSEAITLSQVRTQMNVVALLDESEPAGLESGGRAALEALIDRRLAMQDLALTPFLLAPADEVEGPLRALRGRTFAGGRDFPAALAHYGLTEDDCRAFFRERASFERYVSFRFKTGQDVSPGAIEAFYRDEYSAGQAALGAPIEPLESVRSSILDILAERQANRLLEQRIMELRALTRIEILAFAPAGGEQ
ncbi:MAG: hypothetical protein OXH83_05535 [Bryobacterales bacterium]|nr:hypothetical protein [Bryobacterales bacterium]